MNIFKKSIIIILSFFLIRTAYSFDQTSDLIVDKIHTILINEYGNYKDRTFLEKIVLKLGKSTFIDNVIKWKYNYRNLDNIIITLHPKMENMAEITDKYLDLETSARFRFLLMELTKLGLRNLQMYYYSTEEFLRNNNLNYNDINIQLIDDAQCNLKYYEQKKILYREEDEIKKEIRQIMDDKRVKFKLGIYIFAFDFFNKIRIGIIQKDMEKMLIKINKS